MSEMPISDAREHLGEVVGRARYAGEETILTDYGAPAAVVISFKEYQRLKHARDDAGEYQLPPESWPRSARAVSTPGAASRARGARPVLSADDTGRVRPAAPAGVCGAGRKPVPAGFWTRSTTGSTSWRPIPAARTCAGARSVTGLWASRSGTAARTG